MITVRGALLRGQFEVTWALFEYHLERLADADYLWPAAAVHWSIRETDAGAWVVDWADSEPDPVPVPTVAWLCWHVDWWWGTAIDGVQGRTLRARADVQPQRDAAAVVARLREHRTEWLRLLEDLDDARLDALSVVPWGEGSSFTVADTAAWVNVELMKNVAEIGQLCLIRRAVPDRP
ncbi:DinB family protein [Yinghuangia soli]|uniref:DinB family protein n=1 Tax=Yinghuangia soli TaxID=2908204 RepID=A0AA41Q6Q9_9ACTN|nr:DinB family protein [Yinghuangia soli]MCF2532508.1 DinB family protein [Yinghuangia soli]